LKDKVDMRFSDMTSRCRFLLAIVLLIPASSDAAAFAAPPDGGKSPPLWARPSFQRIVGGTPTIKQSPAVGCGPLEQKKFTVTRHKAPPVLEPAPSRATVYFITYTIGGQRKIGANGEWVAAGNNRTYGAFQVDPGIVRLCASYSSTDQTSVGYLAMLTAEAGKTYYLVDRSVGGWAQLDEDAWIRELERCKCSFVTSRVRR
jgi:hypothetical protein